MEKEWRKKLAVLWLARFVGMSAITGLISFLPLYVSHLGITDASEAAMWAGLLIGAASFCAAADSLSAFVLSSAAFFRASAKSSAASFSAAFIFSIASFVTQHHPFRYKNVTIWVNKNYIIAGFCFQGFIALFCIFSLYFTKKLLFFSVLCRNATVSLIIITWKARILCRICFFILRKIANMLDKSGEI